MVAQQVNDGSAYRKEMMRWMLWTGDRDGLDDFDLAAALHCPVMGLYRFSKDELKSLMEE